MAKNTMREDDQRAGAALLEVALTLPLLLLVAVGIFEFGRAYQTWQILTNAAREGARIAVLPGIDDDAVEERVQQYLAAGLIPDADDGGRDDRPRHHGRHWRRDRLGIEGGCRLSVHVHSAAAGRPAGRRRVHSGRAADDDDVGDDAERNVGGGFRGSGPAV